MSLLPEKRAATFELVHEFPEGTPIVAMIEFKGEIMIATPHCIYRMRTSTDTPTPL